MSNGSGAAVAVAITVTVAVAVVVQFIFGLWSDRCGIVGDLRVVVL